MKKYFIKVWLHSGEFMYKKAKAGTLGSNRFVTAFKFVQAPTISQHFPEMFLWDRISV